MVPLENSLLILSNLAILPIIVKLLQIGDLIDAFLFTLQIISSMFYHSCKDLGACIIHPNILSFFDVLLASSLIISLSLQYATCIHSSVSNFSFWKYRKCCEKSDSIFKWNENVSSSDINRQIKTIITLFLISINAIWLAINKGSNDYISASANQKVFTLVYSISVVVYALYKHINSPYKIRINKKLLVIGIVVGIIGYILFEIAGIDIVYNYYYITHSLWHILSSFGIYLLILAAEPLCPNKSEPCTCNTLSYHDY